ncbi:MAG: hypothetical protein JWM57_124 [Phycisphaerales bacterium]|nr:hypothetical protein [Phycisphaerales bacterium]
MTPYFKQPGASHVHLRPASVRVAARQATRNRLALIGQFNDAVNDGTADGSSGVALM